MTITQAFDVQKKIKIVVIKNNFEFLKHKYDDLTILPIIYHTKISRFSRYLKYRYRYRYRDPKNTEILGIYREIPSLGCIPSKNESYNRKDRAMANYRSFVGKRRNLLFWATDNDRQGNLT